MAKNETKIIAERGKQEILIIREFDAPRELVFKAYTDPELYEQWIGPRGLEIKLENLNRKMVDHGDIFKKMKKEMNSHSME